MTTPLTTNAFKTTYKDDFADSSGFHRILFNAGKALQAREVTQLQTILQNQIQRFGDNIFKEGAVVKPGGPNVNPKFEFIKLDTTTNTLPTDTASLVGTTFTGATSSIQAKVLQVLTADGSDPDTIYVQYTNTTSATVFTSPIRMSAGENISNGSITLTVQSTNTTVNPAVGVGTLATLSSGIYYARGHFVFTADQSKVISRYTDTPSVNLGFIVSEDIVTATDDTSLYDNQGAAPNLTAPGADRYRITLFIATESEVSSDQNFIHVATIKNGEIFNAISINDAYNIPSDVIAKRIFENSGDYIVKPFDINFSLDSESTHLNLNVSPGIAVVDGFRAARDFPSTIRINKPTKTVTINNDVTPVDFGNAIVVNTDSSPETDGLPDLSGATSPFPTLNLRDAKNHAGSTIGTAKVKAISHFENKLKYHLFDVQMNSGQAFRNVKSIGTSTSEYFNPELENAKAVIKEPFKTSALFPLTNRRPKAITDISFAVQRRFTATANGSGQASISLSASGETFTNVSDWIIGSDSSVIYPSADFTNPSIGGNGTQSSTITGLRANGAVEILAYVNKGSPSIKTKTLTTITEQIAGSAQLALSKPDIFDVIEIIKTGDSNTLRTNNFILDNGQRDNFYGLGKLNLKPGLSTPDGCQVKYRYFEHGVAGDLFAVNSYTGQVTYDQIPRFRTGTGENLRLRNFLDFRSVVHADGSFSGSGARVIEQPQPGTLVTSDNEYFLAQAGKLIIDREGIIRFVTGMSDFEPVPPNTPDQTLGLYDVYLRANTDNDSDLIVNKLEHRRFTMKDISKLETRLSNVEEVASLSLLEVDTKYLQTLDSAGNDRSKSGFFVDKFCDHSLTDARLSEGHRASIDPLNHYMRPAFYEDNIRLLYDSANSTNTIRKGDNVYMAYDEVPYINQSEATKSILLNPFAVVIYEGLVTLSPASDEWRDVERLPDKIITGGTRLASSNAYNWNNWSWSWGGVPNESLGVGSSTNTQRGMVNRIVSQETILDLVEDRVLQTALLPFIRSRKVHFKVQGLRPNTRMFVLMDGINISAFARSETFIFHAADTNDFGNTLNGLTAHPDGTNTITSDNNGEIAGSLIIPNNDNIRFRVGTRQIKFLDISVDKEVDAGCIGRATYAATGFLDTKQSTYLSTRQLNVQGFDVPPPIYHNNNDNNDGNGPSPGGGGYNNITNSSGYYGNSYANDAQAAGGTSYSNDMYSNDAQSSNSGGGGGGGGCVIATHGLSTGGFTIMEKAKAEIWCAKKYHGKLLGEAFRKGYRAAGMKHINAGTAESVYQEFKDFVGYGRGVKKGFKIAVNYYWRTFTFIAHGLFLKG